MWNVYENAWKVSPRRAYCIVADSRSEDLVLVAQPQAKPAPCDFAASNMWRVHQAKADAILYLRPVAQQGLPIPLLHRVFCNFTRYFHEPCLDERSADYLVMAQRLCQEMPSAFNSEVARRRAFETIFRSLDKDLTQHREYLLSTKVSIATVTGLDVAKIIQYGGGRLVVMLEEFGHECGDIYIWKSVALTKFYAGIPRLNAWWRLATQYSCYAPLVFINHAS